MAEEQRTRAQPDPLATYLRDHLAGAAAAIELLEFLRDRHSSESVGDLAASLLADVEADRTVLRELFDRIDGSSSPVKEAAAWVTAKLSRLKLDHRAVGDLGVLEALETLALGILGKLALWHALVLVARDESRLTGVDFGRLAARAETQHERVEEFRLEVARSALVPHLL
jgi:hypothetical protein